MSSSSLPQKHKKQQLQLNNEQKKKLNEIAKRICQPGKGVLATDDTAEDLKPRFEKLGLENSAEQRRAYRQILYTTTHFNHNLSSVILIEETFRQSTDNGRSFVDVLHDHNVIVGVQADQGVAPFEGGLANETHTKGLDGLDKRLEEYAAGGAEFAKWRAVISIVGNGAPSEACIQQNAHELAEYAAACQRHGLVPLVEPDVQVAAGKHTIAEAQRASERMWAHTMAALTEMGVYLEGIVLKPNMVTPGADGQKSSPDEVAAATIDAPRRTIPSAVPGCVFLSGGQAPLDATANMNAMGKVADKPWYLTFCYGRAIQGPVMEAWKGKAENVKAAQKVLLHRSAANGMAQTGKYQSEEQVASEIGKLSI